MHDDPERPATKAAAGAGKGPRARAGQADGDVGSALRSVYQKTVEEKVPDEFLDLLGKLD